MMPGMAIQHNGVKNKQANKSRQPS